MPVVKKNQRMTVMGTHKFYSIRYEMPHSAYEKEPYFFGVPDDQAAIEGGQGVIQIQPHSQRYYGVKGANVQEVETKLKALFEWEMTNGTTREYFILVDIWRSNKRFKGHDDWLSELKQQGHAEIVFGYALAAKVKKGEFVHWYQWNPENKGSLSSRIGRPENSIEVPYTEERHKVCIEIMRKFEELQQQINKVFATQKEKALDNFQKLLPLG